MRLLLILLLFTSVLSAQEIERGFNGWIYDVRTTSVNNDSTLTIQGFFQNFTYNNFNPSVVSDDCIVIAVIGDKFYQLNVEKVLQNTTLLKLVVEDYNGLFSSRLQPSYVYIGKKGIDGVLPLPDPADRRLFLAVVDYNNRLNRINDSVSQSTLSVEYGQTYLVDTEYGTATISLPSGTPDKGDSFTIIDAAGNAGTNNITVDFLTAQDSVFKQSKNYIINADQRTVKFIYTGIDSIGWITEY